MVMIASHISDIVQPLLPPVYPGVCGCVERRKGHCVQRAFVLEAISVWVLLFDICCHTVKSGHHVVMMVHSYILIADL